LIENIKNGILDYDPETVVSNCKKAVESGIDPHEIIKGGITEALVTVGEKFENGDLFLVHLISAAHAAEKGLKDVIEPEIAKTGKERDVIGKVVLGTVEGDIHEIGKSIVGALLFASGFEVFDVGKDVSVKQFITKIKEVDADIVATSALLSTTMPIQKDLIEGLISENLRDKVKVMVGGAPVTAEWAEEIGADSYAEDAQGAVTEAIRLLS
jgi:trimethylamine corrinoid protein